MPQLLRIFSRKWFWGTLLLLGIIVHLSLASLPYPAGFSDGSELTLPHSVVWQENQVDSFRVATFNIHRSKGKDGIRDLSRAGDVLKGADIIALNELSGTLFYGWTDQAEQLAQQLGMGWLFAPAVFQWYQPFFGNGLLSLFKVKTWKVEPLPRDVHSKRAFRNLITAVIPIKNHDVTVLVTHLERDVINATQLRFILERFMQVQGPVILMGDLNVDLSNEQIVAVLADARNRDAIQDGIGGFWRLDWIITRGFEVLDGGYTPRGISDHAHFWLDLKFKTD